MRLRWIFLIPLAGVALLGLWPAGAFAATFANPVSVTIPGTGTGPGAASPYPIPIPVTGLRAPTGIVIPKLVNFGHEDPDDVDMLLVDPGGRAGMLMSDACGFNPIEDVIWSIQPFDELPDMTDNGPCASNMGAINPGSYDPSSDPFPTGPPAPPYGFGVNASGNPNGTWNLYVFDDSNLGMGDIEGGVELDVDVTGTSAVELPDATPVGGETLTRGRSSPYPLTTTIAGQPTDQVLNDVNVAVGGVYHSFPDDLDLLLVGPQGQTVVLMSDACGGTDVNNIVWGWDDESAAMADSGPCTNGNSFRPTDVADGADTWATAPAGPYGSDLSVFDFTNPNGSWRVFAVDDAAGDEGFMTTEVQISLTMRPKADLPGPGATTVDEGQSANVTLQRSATPPLGPASIRVTATPGTAAESDFPPIDTTVNFARDEATKTVTIGASDDISDEPDETYSLSFTSPTGDMNYIGAATTTITIADNDDALPGPGPGPDPDPTPGSGDTTAPETTIDKAPQAKTAKHKAKFKFSASETPATFECSLDSKQAFELCTSPKKYKGLDDGKHKFFVRATDAAGNLDSTPAKARWKVG